MNRQPPAQEPAGRKIVCGGEIIPRDHWNSNKSQSESLQLRVLGFGFFQNGDVGIGVFPQREELFVGGEGMQPGRIAARAGGTSRLQRVSACDTQMRQSSRPAVPDDPTMIENLLELVGGGRALSGSQVGLAAHIKRIQARDIVAEINDADCDLLEFQ